MIGLVLTNSLFFRDSTYPFAEGAIVINFKGNSWYLMNLYDGLIVVIFD